MTLKPSPSIAQMRIDLLEDIETVRASASISFEPVLVAVSKKQPEERIDAALHVGHRVFGENRVQEAQGRWAERRKSYSDLQLRLIGPLQTNKAEDAIALFDVIETLDRPKLARSLAKAMNKLGRSVPVLIQVNTGEEPQKAGCKPGELPELLAVAQELGLSVVGLMCIPPADEPSGPHFALLAGLAKRYDLVEISMGMSGDYQTAIRFGATHVRIGSAFFGSRIDV
ncbi:MAG: YggS family pyridoxal phosphate-dependent enzyme [Pseudomonadota bacterium]